MHNHALDRHHYAEINAIWYINVLKEFESNLLKVCREKGEKPEKCMNHAQLYKMMHS